MFVKNKMEDSEFYNNFLGSSSANMVFAILFFVGAWLKTRLNNSKCAGNCYCFQCESSLKELEQNLHRTQTAQKEMLKHIIRRLNKDEEGMGSLTSTPIEGETMV